MSSSREYSVAMSLDDWKKIDQKMTEEFGNDWSNFCADADKAVIDDNVMYRWTEYPFINMTMMLEKLIDELDYVTKYDIGDDPFEYGVNRQDSYESHGLLQIDRPMAIIEYKELYLVEAERIIRELVKEVPSEKVREIFKKSCNGRAYGIEPVINNYLG